MSLHDNMVKEAIMMGKSSSEYSASARKYANTVFVLAIVAVCAWYFMGWVWAFMPIAVGVFTAFQSINARMIAARLARHEQNGEETR